MEDSTKREILIPTTELEGDFQLLADFGKALTSTLSLHEVLRIIMERVNSILQPKHWSLFLINNKKKELYLGITQGEVADKLKQIRLPIHEGIAGWVASEKKSVLVPDVRYDKRFSMRVDQITNFVTKSIICVPMVNRGEVLGVIELINAEEDKEFSMRDLNMLLVLADFAAIAIDNARTYKQLQKLSLKDPLTSAYNIRYLHNILNKWILEKQIFSMIFLDLDKFKNIVDTYGHIQGSNLLVKFADFLISRLNNFANNQKEIGKNIQTAAVRYGGDEFVLLLRGIGRNLSMKFAESLIEELREKKFTLEDETQIQLSISIGIGFFPDTADNKRDLMAKTDQAMFQAKENGRSRIIVAS